MELNGQNYVDKAEEVIKALQRTDKRGNAQMPLTTSKLRKLLAMASELKTDAQRSREPELSADMQSRVQYLKMRIAYEAGRDRDVFDFVRRADLLEQAKRIGKDRKRLLLFCDYLEALTAYHRFYGGKD